MEFNSKILLFVGIIFCGLICESYGHSYVTSPRSRSNQKQTETGCRGPACLGPCDVPLSKMKSVVGTYARGDTITVQWPRNNHAGGFIRFAWAPTSQSDSASAFDTNVQQINCHEVGGCGPSDPSDPNGGDTNPADGSYKPCQSNITVPGTLSNGGWTLQWAWFGGAFSLGDYYSCVDITVDGGATAALTPVFKGGDYSYPGQQKCKFFNTDKLHVCVNEPCNAPIYTAAKQQSGLPAYLQLNADGTTIAANSAPAPTPATPAAPSTTAATSPMTTGRVAVISTPPAPTPVVTPTPAPTPVVTPVPAPTPVVTPTPAPTPVVTPTPAPTPVISTPDSAITGAPCGNDGHMVCASMSTYQTCTRGTWAAPQTCQTGLTCTPSGVYIYCI